MAWRRTLLPLPMKSASGAGLKESSIAFAGGRLISPMNCVHGTEAGTPGGALRSWHEAGRGGSAIRHECERVGTIASTAAGKRMHGSRDGEYRFVLEAGVQHIRRKPEDHFGKSGAGESAAGKEDRSQRQPVAGEFAAARIGAGQLHSVTGHP